MTKNKQIDLKINVEAMSHDGRGIATVDSKKLFIQDALPGETVSYRVTQKRASFNEAKMLSVISPSTSRVIPVCTHFGLCGGCQLQHMSDVFQQELKQKTLREQLLKFARVKPVNELPLLTAETLGYRRKARLGVKFVIKKDKVLVGFREKASRYLADLSSCEVLHPKIGKKLTELADLVSSLSVCRRIAQIEFAMGDEDAALVFRHLSDLTADDEAKLIDFGKKAGFHIYLQPNRPMAITKLYPADGVERLTYSLPDEALTFYFYPLDFTQVNLGVNRLMIKQAMDLLDVQQSDRVLDLFCGIGNFTLPLAKRSQHVVGVEGSAEMIERARDNAKNNQIEGINFYVANLMEPDSTVNWMQQSYDKLLLDPPRAGAKEILPYIAKMQIKKIVYVSCNPATLARDCELLVHQYGYQLTHAGVMNMFPHTAHIEAMAVFEK